MIKQIFAVTALLCAATTTGLAQTRSRMLVELKGDALLTAYQNQFAADERFADSRLMGYHDRSVVGTAMFLERQFGFRALIFLSRALRGFAAELTPQQIERLKQHPLIKSVEPDAVIRLNAQTLPWGIDRTDADISSTQAGNGSGDVTGVHIYVIDTGIDTSHPDLNVVEHVTFAGVPNADCHGHGTHVSGIAAARDNAGYVVGMAPGAPLHGVKVLSCDGFGFTSQIVQGIDWVTANAVKPAVANMSLGSVIPIAALNNAVRASAASGILYAVAAGNGNPFNNNSPLDACYTSPANAGYYGGYPNGVITVGAVDTNENQAAFSNYGICVDLWAPGVNIPSTWPISLGGTYTASGTSMASPHVAGAAALFLSRYPTAPIWFVELALQNLAAVPGTTAQDGRPIRRLSVAAF
jgi:subtilisin family serine protease